MPAFHPHCLGHGPIITPGCCNCPKCPLHCTLQASPPTVGRAASTTQIGPCHLAASLLSVAPVTLYIKITLLSLAHRLFRL